MKRYYKIKDQAGFWKAGIWELILKTERGKCTMRKKDGNCYCVCDEGKIFLIPLGVI